MALRPVPTMAPALTCRTARGRIPVVPINPQTAAASTPTRFARPTIETCESCSNRRGNSGGGRSRPRTGLYTNQQGIFVEFGQITGIWCGVKARIETENRAYSNLAGHCWPIPCYLGFQGRWSADQGIPELPSVITLHREIKLEILAASIPRPKDISCIARASYAAIDHWPEEVGRAPKLQLRRHRPC